MRDGQGRARLGAILLAAPFMVKPPSDLRCAGRADTLPRPKGGRRAARDEADGGAEQRAIQSNFEPVRTIRPAIARTMAASLRL